MFRIDLNCDLGESFGAYRIGRDEEIIPYITSANVACGFHAGDPLVMERTVALCVKHDVHIGAHPGLPDLVGFGRRNMAVSPSEAKAMVKYQLGALQAFCRAEGVKLWHVKPHGALYNMAAKDEKLARAIAEAVYDVDPGLILMGLSGSEFMKAAAETGLISASEVFADRAYQNDGSLRPRSFSDSMITDEDEAVKRVIRMVKEGRVLSAEGTDVEIRADSVCVHGDGARALEFVRKIRDCLSGAGIDIKALGM